MEKISKQEVIEFANKYLGNNNYAVIYKRKGEDKNIKKVDKPAITPIEANREAQSVFLKKFMELPSSRVFNLILSITTNVSATKPWEQMFRLRILKMKRIIYLNCITFLIWVLLTICI